MYLPTPPSFRLVRKQRSNPNRISFLSENTLDNLGKRDDVLDGKPRFRIEKTVFNILFVVYKNWSKWYGQMLYENVVRLILWSTLIPLGMNLRHGNPFRGECDHSSTKKFVVKVCIIKKIFSICARSWCCIITRSVGSLTSGMWTVRSRSCEIRRGRGSPNKDVQ